MRLRPVLALLPLLLLPVLAFAGDEVDDQKSIIKRKAYGDYWDRLDALSKLGSIGTIKAAEAVAEVLDDDEAPIREAAALSLSRMKGADTIQFIANKLLTHTKPVARATVLRALGIGKREEALKPIEALLAKSGETPEVRIAAARALGMIGDKSSAATLEAQAAGNGPPAVRAECMLALAEIGSGSADALTRGLKDGQALVRAAAVTAAAALDPKGSGDAVKAALADKEIPVRVAAADALYACFAEAAFEPASQALADPDWPVRVAAINALYEVWTKDVIGVLIARLAEEKGRLRLDLSMALTDMTGKDIGYDPLAWKGWWESNKDTFELPKKPKKRKAREAKNGGTTATFFNIPILTDRVSFVIDFSGSMKTVEDRPDEKGGTAVQGSDSVMKIDLAITELERCLAKLDPKVKFNVFLMCYARDPIILQRTGFSKNLVPATPANLKNASKFIDDSKKMVMAVQRGRGDMYDQIDAAFLDEEVDTVIILSDGKPSYGMHVENDEFHYFIRRDNRWRKIMLHCVLTGTKGTDAKFMEELSGDTGGMFTKK